MVDNLIANSSIHIWTSIYVTIVAVNRDIVNVRGKLSLRSLSQRCVAIK